MCASFRACALPPAPSLARRICECAGTVRIRAQQAAHQPGQRALVDRVPAEQLPGGSGRGRGESLELEPLVPAGATGGDRSGLESGHTAGRAALVSTPRPDPEPGDPLNVGRSTAFGDITLLQLVSPSPRLV